MGVPVLLIKAVVGTIAKKYAKAKVIKDVTDFLINKDVKVMDKVISYIPSYGGKAVRYFKKYREQTKKMLEKIAKNQNIIRRLQSGERMGNRKKGGSARWSVKKALKNIERAKTTRNKWVKDQIKKEVKRKVLNKIPGKRLGTSVVNLAKAIHNKEGWHKISKKAGSLLFNMGERDITHLFNTIDYYGNLNITANQFWRRISANHSAEYPLITTSGGIRLRYMLRLKDKYQDQIFDREFFFFANSPQTGNFEQNLHSYDPVKKEYSVPIRGWGGTRIKYYHFYNQIPLSNVVNICCNTTVDFGASIYHQYLFSNVYDETMIYWIRKDPFYKKNIE